MRERVKENRWHSNGGALPPQLLHNGAGCPYEKR